MILLACLINWEKRNENNVSKTTICLHAPHSNNSLPLCALLNRALIVRNKKCSEHAGVSAVWKPMGGLIPHPALDRNCFYYKSLSMPLASEAVFT